MPGDSASHVGEHATEKVIDEHVDPDHHVEVEQKVTPLELFFDLVFVFAFTQVTAFMADDPTWRGLIRGMLILAAVWWAWVAYAWLTNNVDPEEERVRVTMFSVMGVMFVLALALPGAFGGDAVVFGVALLVVRMQHIGLYAFGTRGHDDILKSIQRLAVTSFIGPVIIVGAGIWADGDTAIVIWAVALVIDFGGGIFSSSSDDSAAHGWTVHPSHFAERHALIVIIALGESIVATGIGASGLDVDFKVIVAAALGVATSCALWWSYFDVVALVAERKLHEAEGRAQAILARDLYSYLHFPVIAGIILFALGGKKVLEHIDEPLKTVPSFGLYAGPAIYYLGHIAFRYRNVHTLNTNRLIAAVLLIALFPLGKEIDAIYSLALVTLIVGGLVAFEAIRYAERRHKIRAEQASHGHH